LGQSLAQAAALALGRSLGFALAFTLALGRSLGFALAFTLALGQTLGLAFAFTLAFAHSLGLVGTFGFSGTVPLMVPLALGRALPLGGRFGTSGVLVRTGGRLGLADRTTSRGTAPRRRSCLSVAAQNQSERDGDDTHQKLFHDNSLQ